MRICSFLLMAHGVAAWHPMTHGADANHPCDNDCRLFCCKWGEEEQCLTDCGCPQHTCPKTAEASRIIAFPRAPTADAPAALVKLMPHGADANHPCDNDCRLFCCKWGEEEQCLTDCGCPQHTCPQAATPAKPVKQMPECDGGQGIVKYFQLNQDVSKCMDIAGGQVAMGAGVQISTCNGQDSQKFIWCSDGRIVSVINDNMCLDIPGGDPSQTSYLQIYPCNGAAGQYWGYDYNAMAISPTQGWQFDNMCMDVDASSGKLVNYWCSPGGSWQAQKWQVNDAVAETSKDLVADTCSVFQVKDSTCFQTAIDCHYIYKAKVFDKDLQDGYCVLQGYTAKGEETTKTVPVIGKLTITEYTKPADNQIIV
jgi:hypothetical protein